MIGFLVNNLNNPFRNEFDIQKVIQKQPVSYIGWNAFIYAGLDSGIPRPIKLMSAGELSILNWATAKRAEIQAKMRGGI